MVLAINCAAQEAIAKLSNQMERSDSDWSDWDILEDPGFCGLRSRVEALEVGSSTALAESAIIPLKAQLDEAFERIADLEGK